MTKSRRKCNAKR